MKRRRALLAALIMAGAALITLGAVTVVQAVMHNKIRVLPVAAGPLAPAPPPSTAVITGSLAHQPGRLAPPVQVPAAELIAVMRVTPVIVPAGPRFVISKTRLLLYTVTASTTILAFVELSPKRLHFTRR